MTTTKFTVEDLLQLPVLKNSKILSGANGIQNEIYYVDILEVPEITGWLRPNEFILTTGYSFQDNPLAIYRLLDEMKRVGGAVIGIKTKRFLYEIPQEAIQKSEEYKVPIIEVPADIPYIDITHSVMEQILNKQVALLREVQDINSRFMNLVLNRRISELVVMIGQLLTCEVAVINQDGGMESSTAGFSSQHIVCRQEIRVGDKVRGYLAITRQVAAEERFAAMCLDQALIVLGIEFSMRDSVKRIREQAREEFFIALLAGTLAMEDIAHYRAKQLGFPTGRPQYVLALQVSESDAGKMVLQELKKNHPFISMAGCVGDLIVAACSTSQTDLVSQRNEAVEIANSLREQISQNRGVKVVLGIGYPRERLSSLHESFAEAKKALETGQKIWDNNRVIHYSDIYVEEMLLDLKDHSALNALYQIFIVPVLSYDQKNGTDLLQTLELYMRFGGNTMKVAKQLFVHRNSVNYRLERIKDILGTDLNDPEIRMKLDLIVRAWKLKIVSV